MKRRSIAIFGGSFDPIHFAHLNFAIEVMEKKAVDEVWFSLAHINPLKEKHPPLASVSHRQKMLLLATKEIPNFRLLKGESMKEGPSYTVELLREITASDQEAHYYFMMGGDAAATFDKWKEPEEILALAKPLVCQRSCQSLSYSGTNPLLAKALDKGAFSTRVMEISSTDIRERLQNGQYCGHLVPSKVLDYIYKNRLYSPTINFSA